MDLARLLQNKRDKYNRPIPKRIEFSHYPDLYWEYIMEDTFDNNIEISTYEVKIKLTVPSGTAYKKQSTVTNRTGYVNGLANVSPVIVIKPTDNLMTITETLTDQNFHIGYPETLTDKVIVIDCEDRIVWLKTDEDDEDGENITQYVDFNSDFFSIIDEYQFDTTGCVIKDVSYIERW
jgi:phage-related protein